MHAETDPSQISELIMSTRFKNFQEAEIELADLLNRKAILDAKADRSELTAEDEIHLEGVKALLEHAHHNKEFWQSEVIREQSVVVRDGCW